MARTQTILRTAEAPAEIAQPMLETHHAELSELNIYWLWTNQAHKTKKLFEHTVERGTDLLCYASGGRFGPKSIIIRIPEDLWENWSADRRAAEVDMALSRLEIGKNAMQIRSFLTFDAMAEVVSRHGAFTGELKRLGKTYSQLAIAYDAEVGTDYTPEETDAEIARINEQMSTVGSENGSGIAAADPEVDASINTALRGRSRRKNPLALEGSSAVA